MSDTVTSIPEPPALPDVPPAPAVPEAPVTEETNATSAAAAGDSGAAGEASGEPDSDSVGSSPGDTGDAAPAQASGNSIPEVVNDDNGQHVILADGTSITTRSHPYPVSNTEWEKYELTHSGDQARYSLVPGDEHYSPYSDPSVPNSHLAQMVEREMQSFADRILHDAEAVVSPLWHGLQAVYQGELKQAIATGGGSGKVEA